MDENGKKIVKLTPSKKDIANCESQLKRLLSKDQQQGIVVVELSENDFPRRMLDLPNGLTRLFHVNPRVKLSWGRPFDEPSKEAGCVEVKHEYIDMTMVSVFYDANINPLRKVATKNAVNCWMKQKHLPREMMFVELGFNGVFTFSKDDFPKEIQYFRIEGDDTNKYLFQKEHLWNIAAKRAKYEKLMFVDSDISPLEDVDWFKRVANTLGGCLFTQGFSQVLYLNKLNKPLVVKGQIMKKPSYTSSYVRNGQTHGVPGGVYCIAKTTLQEIGYFNYLPFGGGDDLWWNELLQIDKRFLFLLQRRGNVNDILKLKVKRENKKLVDGVNVQVCHFYHGDRENRSYGQRQYILLTQFPWQDRLVVDDARGLASWVDTNHYFYNVASKMHLVNNKLENANNLLKEHIDYVQFHSQVRKFFDSVDSFQSKDEAVRFIYEKLNKFRR